MTKILLGVLTLAAFLYAVWLVILRRHLPDPDAARGWKRRFLVAVGLFVVFLVGAAGRMGLDSVFPEGIGGQAVAFGGEGGEVVEAEGVPSFVEAVREIWQQLRVEDLPAFGEAAGGAAEAGLLRRQEASMLRLAFERLSFHKQNTRGETGITCYRPSPLTTIKSSNAEAALKQIELLRDLKRKGTLDAATAEKAHATLARELEMMYRVRQQGTGIDWRQAQMLLEDYRAGRIEAGDVASASAGIVFALEAVAVPESASPAVRLHSMRNRVRTLLRRGPFAHDWRESYLQPNVYDILKESGLLDDPDMPRDGSVPLPNDTPGEEVTRLQTELLDKQVEAGVLDVETAERVRAANGGEDAPDSDAGARRSPVREASAEDAEALQYDLMVNCTPTIRIPPAEERGEELKRLQAELLDKQVEAGVLDVETAERVRAANEREDAPDYATEADIRAFQEKGRRVVRLLYRRGEVPPSFVRELERAIAMEIIAFDPAKACRDEMHWLLRSAIHYGPDDHILDALVERKLVPPASNFRHVLRRDFYPTGLSDHQKKRLESILAMLDGDAPILLPEDGEQTISLDQVPQADREYILKMRRVVRVLCHASVIRMNDMLMRRFEEALGVPLLGRLAWEVPPDNSADNSQDNSLKNSPGRGSGE